MFIWKGKGMPKTHITLNTVKKQKIMIDHDMYVKNIKKVTNDIFNCRNCIMKIEKRSYNYWRDWQLDRMTSSTYLLLNRYFLPTFVVLPFFSNLKCCSNLKVKITHSQTYNWNHIMMLVTLLFTLLQTMNL